MLWVNLQHVNLRFYRTIWLMSKRWIPGPLLCMQEGLGTRLSETYRWMWQNAVLHILKHKTVIIAGSGEREYTCR